MHVPVPYTKMYPSNIIFRYGDTGYLTIGAGADLGISEGGFQNISVIIFRGTYVVGRVNINSTVQR